MRPAQTLVLVMVLMLPVQMLRAQTLVMDMQMLLVQTLDMDFRKAQIPETTPVLVIMQEQIPETTHEKIECDSNTYF